LCHRRRLAAGGEGVSVRRGVAHSVSLPARTSPAEARR
jgi:hypothetical protein